jgi:hypothetical protein
MPKEIDEQDGSEFYVIQPIFRMWEKIEEQDGSEFQFSSSLSLVGASASVYVC